MFAIRTLTAVLVCAVVCLPFASSAQTRPPAASMTIQVKVPPDTPPGDSIWILPGQQFDWAKPRIQMTRLSETSDTWKATVTAPEGTILRYIFVRNNDAGKVEVYVPFATTGYAIDTNLKQTQNPLRQALVTNGATISEAVAQWTDTTPAENSAGTLSGTVVDQAGNPLPGIWVSAGPHQTMTDASGAFQLQGVPAGPCTITAMSENGDFLAVSQAANITANAANVQAITLPSALMSNVTFTITVPADTPAGAVPLLLGDTYRLGSVVFGGQPEPETTRYIEMKPLGVNQWTYATQLGNGVCLNYLYTLGHRLLDYEIDGNSQNVTRSVCVDGPATVTDTVAHWTSPAFVPVQLTATSPTGPEDNLYVITDSANATEPVKMWPAGLGKATYTLYVRPNTTLRYRYIRNADPDLGLEIVGVDSNPPAYRSLAVGSNGAASDDTIVAWRNQMREPALSTVTTGITGPILQRSSGEPFQTGLQVVDYWRRSWLPLVDSTMQRMKNFNAQWVLIPSVWTPVILDPPKGELIPDVSFPPQDLIAHIRSAKAAGLHVVLRSFTYPHSFPGTHSPQWFDQLFAQVQSFAIYNAQIAQQEGVEQLQLTTLGFDADKNSDSATRTYISAKWKAVIAAIRASGFTGKISTDSMIFYRPEYDWFGDLDYLGERLWFPIANSDNDTVQTMYNNVIAKLNSQYLPIVNRFHKPLVFTEIPFYSADSSAEMTLKSLPNSLPADPSILSDYDEQARAYQATLLAFAATPWIQGAYSFGYAYFDFDSKGYSIRAKTAEQIVSGLYRQFNDTTGGALAPTITSVNTAAGSPDIAQNDWIEIKGANLAPASVSSGMTWSSAPEFATGAMPSQLSGVRVTINGKPAFVYYVSPNQVNVLSPLDNTTGQAQMVVTVGGVSSAPFTVNIRESTPSFPLAGSTSYVVAQHTDYSLVGPSSLSSSGYAFLPARPGETILLYAFGLGTPATPLVNGASTQSGMLPSLPVVTIGGETAKVNFAGVVSPGLYQLNVVVPQTLTHGDYNVLLNYKGQSSPPGDLIAIQ